MLCRFNFCLPCARLYNAVSCHALVTHNLKVWSSLLLTDLFLIHEEANLCVNSFSELPEKRLDITGVQAPTLMLCQETVVKWFANFTLLNNKSPVPSPSGTSGGNTATRYVSIFFKAVIK